MFYTRKESVKYKSHHKFFTNFSIKKIGLMDSGNIGYNRLQICEFQPKITTFHDQRASHFSRKYMWLKPDSIIYNLRKSSKTDSLVAHHVGYLLLSFNSRSIQGF